MASGRNNDHGSGGKSAPRQFEIRREPTFDEFSRVCAKLFGEQPDTPSRLAAIFEILTDAARRDSTLDPFQQWVNICANPVNVLVVVDVQNDFIDGSLALKQCGYGQDGRDVIEPINRLIREGTWSKVVYSLDWHPEDHISFFENLHKRELHPDSKVSKGYAKPFDTVVFLKPHVEQKLWPKHCVQNSWGSELHQDLVIAPSSEQVRKGQHPDVDAYSVFAVDPDSGTNQLRKILADVQATHLYVCGLAYDICVRATCLDGLRLGYPLALVEDCCRGVDEVEVDRTRAEILENNGLVTDSDWVLTLIKAGTTDLAMAHQAAVRLTMGGGLK